MCAIDRQLQIDTGLKNVPFIASRCLANDKWDAAFPLVLRNRLMAVTLLGLVTCRSSGNLCTVRLAFETSNAMMLVRSASPKLLLMSLSLIRLGREGPSAVRMAGQM